MPECNGCGAFVSRDFARVFGSDRDAVYACPDCTTKAGLVHGDAARDS